MDNLAGMVGDIGSKNRVADTTPDKRFDEWNGVKSNIHYAGIFRSIKEGDIWWCSMGENVGVEINGKQDKFLRPVLVLRKLSRFGFMGIPMTSKEHSGKWYVHFEFREREEIAVLAQARVLSVNRLWRKWVQCPTQICNLFGTGLESYIANKNTPHSYEWGWAGIPESIFIITHLTIKINGFARFYAISLAQKRGLYPALAPDNGTSATLKDIRDNNTYTVKKLADGRCWMTQNLRLTGRAAAFTPNDTQVDTNFTMTTSASNTGTWCTDNVSTCIDKFQYIDTGNTYGILYNWYTATAGSGKYETSSPGVNVDYSICPRGWRLPTSGSSGHWQGLYDQYSSATEMLNVNGPAIILAGYRGGSSTYNQGSSGYYWSSRVYGFNDAYSLSLDSLSVYPVRGNRKNFGFSVRCLAQN